MDNIIIDSSDSDSDYEDSSDGHSEREETIYESEHFLNHIKNTTACRMFVFKIKKENYCKYNCKKKI